MLYVDELMFVVYEIQSLRSQSVRNNVSILAYCSVQFRNGINARNVIFKFCNKFHCIMFLNCSLCLNFPNLPLSFTCVAFLCESLTTLPPNKRKCVKTSYFAFCFFCASYCSRVIHFGLLSILLRYFEALKKLK